MKVYRAVRKGRNILCGPWSHIFRGQTADNLYSVAKGRGNMDEWLYEMFRSLRLEVEEIDLYELAISPADVVKNQDGMGELLISKESLLKAKVIKVRRIKRDRFLAKNKRHHSDSFRMKKFFNDAETQPSVTDSLESRYFREAVKKAKEKLGEDADPWDVAKAAHEMLGLPVK